MNPGKFCQGWRNFMIQFLTHTSDLRNCTSLTENIRHSNLSVIGKRKDEPLSPFFLFYKYRSTFSITCTFSHLIHWFLVFRLITISEPYICIYLNIFSKGHLSRMLPTLRFESCCLVLTAVAIPLLHITSCLILLFSQSE